MHLKSFVLIAACAIACVTARAQSYDYKEAFTKSDAFPANGKLSLANVNGAVEIRAWDKNQILIEGEKSAKTEEELKQIQLTMDVSDSQATIQVRLPKRSGSWFGGSTIRASVRFTIHVPATVAIERVDVVNSSVTLDGLSGSIAAESVNGQIRATRLAGDASLHTVNGTIAAEFAGVRQNQKLKFETVNGSITVALPADAGAKIRGGVVNGQISSEFPFTRDESASRHRVNGTIGDGRALVDARTVNGAIRIVRL